MRACRPTLRALVLSGCVLGLGVPGCGSSQEAALVPVSGTVRVAGEPLTVGWLTFYPDATRGNNSTRLPIAELQNDGTYELSTNGKSGAACGWYKVVVAASREPIPLKPPRNPDGTPKDLRWLVHEKYTRPETTDARIEVVEKPAAGSYDLNLSR